MKNLLGVVRSFAVSMSILMAFVAVLPSIVLAQDYVYATGKSAFSAIEPVELGYIDLSNGNLHLEIPLSAAPQRGRVPLVQSLVYDSRIWKVVTTTSSAWQPTNVPNSQGGWRFVSTADPGTVSKKTVSQRCDDPLGQYRTYTIYGSWVWTAPDSSQKKFAISTTKDPYCQMDSPYAIGYAIDSSGYRMEVSNYTQAVVYAPDGTRVYPSVVDSNGNNFSKDTAGNTIDTLGRTPVVVTTNGSSETYYDVLNSQGNRTRYTVTTGSIAVSSSIGKSGVTEYSGNLTVVTSIAMPSPNGNYTFAYWPNGELKSVTLPTGGTITYTYSNFTDSYGSRNVWVTKREVGPNAWNYPAQVITSCATGQQNCQQKITVTKPSGDYVINTFTLNGGAWKASAQYYGSSGGGLLKSLATEYDLSQTCSGCAGAAYVRTVRNTTTVPLPSGANLYSKTEYVYDSPQTANVSAIKEWNYSSGSFSSTPDRETNTTYITSTNYNSQNIINLPNVVTVKKLGSLVALTQYGYDDPNALTHITGITHHNDTSSTIRGNVTSVSRLVSGTTCTANTPQCLTTTMSYDSTGQVLSVTDSNGNATTYKYNDSFYNDNGSNAPSSYSPPQSTNAYVTEMDLANGHSLKYRYYFSGQMAFDKDLNDVAETWNYDVMGRQTKFYTRSGGWTLDEYSSPTQRDLYTALNEVDASSGCVSCRHDRVLTDAFGRPTQGQLVNDPDGGSPAGPTYQDIGYDSSGRVSASTNPYRNSAPSENTDTVLYDGLDRAIKTTHSSDSTASQTVYGAALLTNGGRSSQLCSTATYGMGYPALSIDEAGKKRQIWVDAFGRTIETDEPDPSNGNSLTFASCYSYNAFDKLVQVAQGNETRSYAYDGIGRLTSTTIPEWGPPTSSSGTTTYSYTNSSGQLCSGNASSVCFRVDPRNVTTTYGYDTLNRVTTIAYNDANPTTPTVTYSYDDTTYNDLNTSYGLGRRTGMTDGSGATAWSYYPDGQVHIERRKIGTVTKDTTYTYNLDGSVASITYPSGRTVKYEYSNALRTLSVKDETHGIQYATGATYSAQGALSSVTYGKVDSGFTGISNTFEYNPQLQLKRIHAYVPTRSVLDLSYGFGSANNGNIANIMDNRTAARSQYYTYDALNRLSSAKTEATSGAGCWGLSYSYDRYGNLLPVAYPPEYAGCTAPLQQFSYDLKNRITASGFIYDDSGSLTNESPFTYAWTGENSLRSSTRDVETTYSYDGDGLRVSKSTGRLYWRDLAGLPLVETDADDTVTSEFIYFNGSRIASHDATGNVNYWFTDHLNTTRVLTTADGTVCYDADSFPFGGEVEFTSTCRPKYIYTGHERDDETGLDYAMYRYYDSRLGRFLSGDLMDGWPTDPQSWNRYAYVLNSPVNFMDPLGLWCDVWNDASGTNVRCGDDLPGGGGGPVAPIHKLLPRDGHEWRRVQVTAITGTISADPGGKSMFCLKQAFQAAGKELVGFDIVNSGVDKIGEFVASHSGPVISPNAATPFGNIPTAYPAQLPSPSKLAPVAGTVSFLKWTSRHVKGNPSAQQTIRRALREEGWKVSVKSVSKFASKAGKIAGTVGVLFTLNGAREAYQQCMSE